MFSFTHRLKYKHTGPPNLAKLSLLVLHFDLWNALKLSNVRIFHPGKETMIDEGILFTIRNPTYNYFK